MAKHHRQRNAYSDQRVHTLDALLVSNAQHLGRSGLCELDVLIKKGSQSELARYLEDARILLVDAHDESIQTGTGIRRLYEGFPGLFDAFADLREQWQEVLCKQYVGWSTVVRSETVDGWTPSSQIFFLLSLVTVLVDDWQFEPVRLADTLAARDLEYIVLALASINLSKPIGRYTLADTLFAIETLRLVWTELDDNEQLEMYLYALWRQFAWLSLTTGTAELFDAPTAASADPDTGLWAMNDKVLAQGEADLTGMVAARWLSAQWTHVSIPEFCAAMLEPDTRAALGPLIRSSSGFQVNRRLTAATLTADRHRFFGQMADDDSFSCLGACDSYVRALELFKPAFSPTDPGKALDGFVKKRFAGLLTVGTESRFQLDKTREGKPRELFVSERAMAASAQRMTAFNSGPDALLKLINRKMLDPMTRTMRAAFLSHYVRTTLLETFFVTRQKIPLDAHIVYAPDIRGNVSELQAKPYPFLGQLFNRFFVCMWIYAVPAPDIETAVYILCWMWWRFTSCNLHGKYDVINLVCDIFGERDHARAVYDAPRTSAPGSSMRARQRDAEQARLSAAREQAADAAAADAYRVQPDP